MMAYAFRTAKGLNHKIVQEISDQKNEPSWMTNFRLQALTTFESMPMPSWGPDLSELHLDDIYYYLKPIEGQKRNWSDVPKNIQQTFLKLGIPQAEQHLLAGVGTQFESEVVYKSLKKEWTDKGVIFCDMNTGLSEHPDLFKKYFSTLVPPTDNPFAALNSAVWSGGSFVYVPKGVCIDLPISFYSKIGL